MDKAIVTVLLIICGITATLAIFNGIYPAVTQSQSVISNAAAAAGERIGSRIEIIQAGSSGVYINMWVKNIGSVAITDVGGSDVFLSSGSSLTLVKRGGLTEPFWVYSFTGSDTAWVQTATIQITITLASPLPAGTYSLKFVTPNGTSDEISFSL
jgi:hypothetical protein